MTTSAQDVFARHFPGLTPEEVDAELSRAPTAGATPISAAAMSFLTEHGGEEAQMALEHYDEAAIQRDRAITTAQTLEELLESSWSLESAAAELGVSRSRVSHRISARTLYAFTVQGRRRVPQWQFVVTSSGEGGADPIPGLAQIVAAIPQHMHPLAVRSFMESPRDDLDGVSPTTYLLAHGPVEPVVDLLIAMGHW